MEMEAGVSGSKKRRSASPRVDDDGGGVDVRIFFLVQLLTEYFLRGPDDRDPTADVQSYRFGKDSLQDASGFN
jgi:hypothetical protein